MAKGKGKAPLAAQKKAQQNAKPNPFEIKRAKTKFDTLGRRVTKTANKKSVVVARADAVNRVRWPVVL